MALPSDRDRYGGSMARGHQRQQDEQRGEGTTAPGGPLPGPERAGVRSQDEMKTSCGRAPDEPAISIHDLASLLILQGNTRGRPPVVVAAAFQAW